MISQETIDKEYK